MNGVYLIISRLSGLFAISKCVLSVQLLAENDARHPGSKAAAGRENDAMGFAYDTAGTRRAGGMRQKLVVDSIRIPPPLN